MSSKRKGNKRERQCATAYGHAGYDVHRPTDAPFNAGDIFGLFDLFCLGPEPTPVHLVQVKSNRAAGIEAWAEDALSCLRPTVQPRMCVCYDREGWRVIDAAPGGYVTVYDGREDDRNMSVGLTAFLDGE